MRPCPQCGSTKDPAPVLIKSFEDNHDEHISWFCPECGRTEE